ncbi:hypothetical protein QTJ16_002259 [Diplocarpon rosae]|uniref:Uncharacterized protein n=1 Tax=Diplocarpon rosae TaxID=946125 RepID=A0AAD9T4Q4_9HELO|nr:hypothetical protein QTJ16_002259 [Diplocarpon rosae]
MALRQPTYHASQRVHTAPAEPQTLTNPFSRSDIADNQEWVLFSPGGASTTEDGDTFTARTRTAGHSRLSDLGSLDTAARSYDYEEGSEDAVEDEEDGELDKLDGYLHAFRREPSVHKDHAEVGGTVLPTHDGLGSFRLHGTNMGEDVQDHLYAFERFNPRRVKRRRESVDLGLGILEEEGAEAQMMRTRRIEKWRMEQSRLLVDEIQKETRRRKHSISSEKKTTAIEDREQEALATLSHVERVRLDEESDSLWSRITKKVIRDLMGIDDDLLAIIFGESLPGDDELSTTPPTTSVMAHKEYDEFSWEHRLLKRVARELGVLISQLSDDPGAFSAYLHSQETPLPNAAPIVISETRHHHPNLEASTLTDLPQFHPTLPTEAASIDIPRTSLASPTTDEDAPPCPDNALSQALTREEWERDLDIKMVFRYLRSRFTAKFTSTVLSPDAECTTSSPSHLAAASTADDAARAVPARQCHTLAQHSGARRNSIERRTQRATVPGSPLARRGSSSCASDRLSVNGRAGVRNSTSSASRPYWDFGGPSVGSGSLIASTGAMGSWGEV